VVQAPDTRLALTECTRVGRISFPLLVASNGETGVAIAPAVALGERNRTDPTSGESSWELSRALVYC